MKAIILAAGKGTRLGALTDEIPKPMVPVNGKPFLARSIEELPDAIDEVVIAIGHHAGQIRDYFKDSYAGRRISYFDASDLTGTAGALFKCKDTLRGKFLVLYGDDFFSKGDLEQLVAEPLAVGVFEGLPNHSGYWQVEESQEGYLRGFRKPTEREVAEGMRVVAGAFVLDERIFGYEPAHIKNGEYGLPQTILKLAADHPVRAVPMPSWRTITYPADIVRMGDYLASLR